MSNISPQCSSSGFAVVDLETTGLTSTDRIVEIGVVLVSPTGVIEDSFETLIRPGIPMFASDIHGITEDMVRHAPTFEMMSSQVASVFDDRKLVAHKASFECGFLAREMKNTGISITSTNFIDTLKLARKLKTSNHRLGTIANHYGVPLENPHEALSDAYATALVLCKMLEDPVFENGTWFDAVPVFTDEFYAEQANKTLWKPRERRVSNDLNSPMIFW